MSANKEMCKMAGEDHQLLWGWEEGSEAVTDGQMGKESSKASQTKEWSRGDKGKAWRSLLRNSLYQAWGRRGQLAPDEILWKPQGDLRKVNGVGKSKTELVGFCGIEERAQRSKFKSHPRDWQLCQRGMVSSSLWPSVSIPTKHMWV